MPCKIKWGQINIVSSSNPKKSVKLLLQLNSQLAREPWASEMTKLQPLLVRFGNDMSHLRPLGVSQIHLTLGHQIYPNEANWLCL
jgi:hypothetical protein